MKLVRVSEMFDVQYGNNFELNKLKSDPNGINYVSRTSKNNGVSAKVRRVNNFEPLPAGIITVSLGGSVLESFVQAEPFYTGYHIYCLTPRIELLDEEKLYYCACISANKYRYNYGRQANRTLKDLLIPDKSEIPAWVYMVDLTRFKNAQESFLNIPTPNLSSKKWLPFTFDQLFNIKKGKRLTKANMVEGGVPFIGAIDDNNGCRQYIDQEPDHKENTITVNYNGSVAEAFYQPRPFWASDDVNVLYPKFEMNQYIALFIISIIKLEKYRFNYGRKWHVVRMRTSEIKLPADAKGDPDFQFMETYIKSLNYSIQV